MNREVFYIAGFDPRSPKYYYSIFKSNIIKTSKIEQDCLNLNKLENAEIPNFIIDYKGCKTRYNFLAWNDIVIEHFYKKFFDVFAALIVSFIGYTISSVTYMIAKYSRTQLIAGYYPLLFILFSYFMIILVCYILGSIMGITLLWGLVAILIFYLGTKAIFYIGQKAGIFWLLSIYKFCYRYAQQRVNGIDKRNEFFANAIINSIKNNQNNNTEIMVVAHSVGTILAISSVAKVIKKCKLEGLNISNLKLVLIGGCVPLTSFQKCGDKFKKELEIVANSDITWLDFSSKIDGACFFMLDYVKRSSVQAKRSPKLISVRFFKIYDKKTYKNIRYKWYEVHFLYLKATQISGGYDYFYMIADPSRLEDKVF